MVRAVSMRVLLTTIFAALIATGAQAQSVADFYKGKNIDLYIGYSVGGAYDLYARLLSRHMSKHVPGNPTIVPKNMEGAGSLRLANWLFNVAPKDEDVYDPDLWRGAIMCSEGERTAFQQLCGTELIDTLRLHHPEPGLFTWWDYRMLAFPKNRGLRIDARRPLVEQLRLRRGRSPARVDRCLYPGSLRPRRCPAA